MKKSNLFGDLDTATLSQIEISKIKANPDQSRKIFDPQALQELADSIKEQGQVQPIVVRTDGDGYIIVAGERRWRACQLNKAGTIDCVIRNDDNHEVVSIIENMQREGLKPVEEARALAKLVNDKKISQTVAGKLVGKKRIVVNQLLKLTTLPEPIQEESLTLDIPKTILVELALVKDPIAVRDLWNKAKNKGLSVAQIREQKTANKKEIEKPASKKTPKAIAKSTIDDGYKLIKNLEKIDSKVLSDAQLAELAELESLVSKVISTLTSIKK